MLYYADRVQPAAAGRDRHRGRHRAVADAVAPGARRASASRRRHAEPGDRIRAVADLAGGAGADRSSALPIISVLFGRGAFTADERASARRSRWPPTRSGCRRSCWSRCWSPASSRAATRATPVKIGIAAVALNLALNFCFMVPLQHMGPPLASSIAAWANVALLGLACCTGAGIRGRPLLRRRACAHAGGRRWRWRPCCWAGADGCSPRCPPTACCAAVGARGRWSPAAWSPMRRPGRLFGGFDFRDRCGGWRVAEDGRPPRVDRRRHPPGKTPPLPTDRPQCSASSPASSPPASRPSATISARMRNWVTLQARPRVPLLRGRPARDHRVAGPASPGAGRPARWRRRCWPAASIRSKHILFHQSAVHAHARLAWIFNCVARHRLAQPHDPVQGQGRQGPRERVGRASTSTRT